MKILRAAVCEGVAPQTHGAEHGGIDPDAATEQSMVGSTRTQAVAETLSAGCFSAVRVSANLVDAPLVGVELDAIHRIQPSLGGLHTRVLRAC
jgi:hypothetical protein